MPSGYGYQSRDNSNYVNWAEVAKGFTDVIDADIKQRESKKAEYDKQDRELAKTLANAPMGQYKDANDFTANYVDAMSKQRLIDYKLFRAGKLKEKDYILKTNNAIDGTNTLFDLQKKYQEQYKTIMAGLTDGSLQAVNGFNMADTEGFADFSKTRAMLDPVDGKVKLIKMKFNEKTGIMEPTQDIVPVGTLMRNMSANIPTFDLSGNAEKDAASLAPLKVAVERAATMAGAGSVTEYVNSPSEFEANFPEGKQAVEEFNNAINNHVEKYLAVPYNITSILTQNTGKYGANSFTKDRDLASKDKSKILLKIDPSTGLNTIDDTAPHYKEQRQEAFDYARNQIVSRIDKEKKIQTSLGQLSDTTLGSRQFEYGKEQKQQGAKNLGENVGKFFTGSANDQSDASNYLNKIGVENYITEDADKNPIFNVMGPNGKYIQFAPKTPNEVRSAISSIMGYAKKYIADTEIDETDAVKYAREFSKGKSVNKPGKTIGGAKEVPPEDNPYNNFVKDIDSSIPSSIFGKTEGNAITNIMDVIEKYNLTAEETTPGQDYIKIKTKGAVPDDIELSFDESDPIEQARQKKRLMDFIRRVGKSELRLEGDEVTTPAPAPTTGAPKPAPRPSGG